MPRMELGAETNLSIVSLIISGLRLRDGSDLKNDFIRIFYNNVYKVSSNSAFCVISMQRNEMLAWYHMFYTKYITFIFEFPE